MSSTTSHKRNCLGAGKLGLWRYLSSTKNTVWFKPLHIPQEPHSGSSAMKFQEQLNRETQLLSKLHVQLAHTLSNVNTGFTAAVYLRGITGCYVYPPSENPSFGYALATMGAQVAVKTSTLATQTIVETSARLA